MSFGLEQTLHVTLHIKEGKNKAMFLGDFFKMMLVGYFYMYFPEEFYIDIYIYLTNVEQNKHHSPGTGEFFSTLVPGILTAEFYLSLPAQLPS